MSIRLRKKVIHGREYWYAVESVRIKGKPVTRHVAYLGKPEDIIAGKAEAKLRDLSSSVPLDRPEDPRPRVLLPDRVPDGLPDDP